MDRTDPGIAGDRLQSAIADLDAFENDSDDGGVLVELLVVEEEEEGAGGGVGQGLHESFALAHGGGQDTCTAQFLKWTS